MKRNAVIKYIMSNGCEFVREGRSHSWWINPEMNKRSAVPRHTEIKGSYWGELLGGVTGDRNPILYLPA